MLSRYFLVLYIWDEMICQMLLRDFLYYTECGHKYCTKLFNFVFVIMIIHLRAWFIFSSIYSSLNVGVSMSNYSNFHLHHMASYINSKCYCVRKHSIDLFPCIWQIIGLLVCMGMIWFSFLWWITCSWLSVIPLVFYVVMIYFYLGLCLCRLEVANVCLYLRYFEFTENI